MSTADSAELLRTLSQPEFYPGDVGRVEVHETHISWVFLAGDRAYKLKKPLVLPFLDYGTPERRREMCRDEVRLNRRLAPGIYLGVRAVVNGPAGLELANEDAPGGLDYVVEMRRYDERATVAAMLERGELGQAQMTAVARRLAAFHAQARRVTVDGRPVVGVERRMTENFHELLAVVEQRVEVGWVLELERFAHAFVVAHAQALAERAWQGFVREVHGDLRAEHVLLDGGVRVVDCVEFDRPLRELDVADDLAFLVMDLTAAGGERFARTLVDAYRACGGDPGEDWLLAFYACYRALVRAKVALLRADQSAAASSARGHHNAAARELLGLAERFAWRARLPLVIVICGAPAAGKSQLARALAEVSGLAHLSSDHTRKRLAGISPEQRGDDRVYSAEFSRLTYAELGLAAARETAARGGALIDATFRHRADRVAFAQAFAGAGPLLFIECRAPGSVLARRAMRREHVPGHVSDATLAVVERESRAWEPLDELAPEAHLILRSDTPVAFQVADVRALLDRRLGKLGTWRSS